VIAVRSPNPNYNPKYDYNYLPSYVVSANTLNCFNKAYLRYDMGKIC